MVGILDCIAGVGISVFFLSSLISVVFPNETEQLKKSAAKGAKLTSMQMSASAYTQTGASVKAYISQNEARRHRANLEPGTVIYFPNGSNITVEEGLNDVECDGWWYAWKTI